MTKQSQSPVAPEGLVTVQEWAELEGPPHFDLVDGRLVRRPDVALWHELLLVDLIVYLATYVRERRLGRIVSSRARLKISNLGGREPDIFFIPNALLDRIGKNLFTGVPPLVVEILSPSNAREDRGPKKRESAGLGIAWYWIVDFPDRRIEVYELRDQPDGSRDYGLAETVEGDAVFRPALFPGLEIPLGQVWPVEFENRTDESLTRRAPQETR